MRARGTRCERRARAFFLCLLLLCASWAAASSIGLERTFVQGVPYFVVRIDLRDPLVKVTPLLTARYPGGAEPASAIVRRYRPTAAITGTQFCTVSLRPIGDLVIDGQLRHFGGMGRALALTPDNQAAFISVPYGHHLDWQGFESVIASGPTLLRNGEISLNPRAEGFTDPHVLGLASRCAVGLTSANKLLFVATEETISLRRLARAMRALGCVEAINLDGGTSSALYYRGRWLISPRRWLVNLLAVFEKVPRSQRVAAAPACAWPSALVRWHREQAWASYSRAMKAAGDEQRVDLLARACELDAENASYCLELARVLQRLGDRAAAATAYARASRRYRAKDRNLDAFKVAQAGEALAPQRPEVVMEYARAARVVGKADLARQAMQRARALFLLGPLPESRPDALAAVVKQVCSRLGSCASHQWILGGVVQERTLAAGSLGLYVHLPEGWDWLPLTRADAAMAQRRYMPWLVHFAVAGVPPQADLTLLREEYLRNTMLITQAPVPTRLGQVEALRFEARAMAGDEPARYQVTMAKQDDLWLIMTAASEERWWAQAVEEFKEVFAGLAFRPPSLQR